MTRHVRCREIEDMYHAGEESLEASKLLNIDHRTVKACYEKARSGCLQDETPAFQRMFLEATRLLAWPTRKLLEALQRYEPLIEGNPSKRARAHSIFSDTEENQKRRAKNKAAQIKKLERYLVRSILPKEADLSSFKTTSRWEEGTAAAHAVPIEWMQHGPETTRLLRKPEGELAAGWLLLLADRHCGATRKREPWRLAVHLAVLPGAEFDSAAATGYIVEHLNSGESGIRTLHLVCGEDGAPTATAPAEELRALLPERIEVVQDAPTRGAGSPFRLRPSFPNPRSLENYLDVMLELRTPFPAPEDDIWRKLRLNAAREDFCTGEFLTPYTWRRGGRGPG